MKRIRVRIHPATESAELRIEVLEGLTPVLTPPPSTPVASEHTGRPPFVTEGQFVEQSSTSRYHADRKVLWVTQTLKDELDVQAQQEAERKAREEKDGAEAAENAQAEAADAAGNPRDAKSDKKVKEEARRSRRRGLPIGSTDPKTFQEQLSGLPAKRKLRVYDPDDLEKLCESKLQSDADVQKRNAAIYKELAPKGAWRRVGLPPSLNEILALEQSHPHFSEVIHFVADRLALAKLSRRPVGIPPMLLAGPPGVGKTHFCEALAQALGVPVRRHPMDQAETSSALLGSEVTWGNTRFGLVFEMLVRGDYANPVVILDELDKAGSFGRSSDPTAVLHSLLEPVSAGRVRDQSVEMELDASLITWIATSNYPWQIAPTLRSRMRAFYIRMPDAEQAILVAHTVVAAAIRNAGVRLKQEPDKEFVLALAHLSAREIYQLTGAAIAQAVRQGSGVVSIKDLPAEALEDDKQDEPVKHVH
ncbi:AAA family ATPase [Hydrogenophaga palleronii]|uniref:AAA family ATPase n=1 Tax=Hydrogenophaga palleronii TaxID=65655 RepID=UPI000825DF2D|nr:AAA family ATPase [Hydrogenophaga palleronii]